MAITIPIISEFDGQGISKAIAEFKQLETNGQKASFAIKKAAVPAGLAIAGLAVALGDAAKGAIEDDAAQQVLALTLRNTTGATDKQVASVENYISAQGKLLGVSDDKLRPALARLVSQTHDITKAQELASLAMDVAAGTGKDLGTVTEALAKASTGNFVALSKLSPELKQMAKDGASADEIFSALSGTFADQATNAAGTAQGQFQRLTVALSETKESIGAALLPAIEAVLPFLQQIGTWAQDHTTIFLIVAGAIAGIAAAVVIANAAITAWGVATKVFTGIQAAFNLVLAANPVVLIGIAIAALIVGVVLAYKKFELFRDIVNGVFDGIKVGFNLLKDYLGTLLGIYKGIFNGFASLWNNTIGKLKITIPDIPGLPGRGQSFGVPDIPMLANGGIVTSPTLAMIGERGPEAVIPLSGANAGGGMGGNTININVNGADPQAVVDALRRYQRMNGFVPITVGV